MLKNTLIFCLILVCASKVCAQRQNVYFQKNDETKVTVRDSADFIRIVREPDSGTVAYNLLEYYLNGKPKRIGKTLEINYVKLDGACITYYKSGGKQSVSSYEKGGIVGQQYNYYPNGKLYTIIEYPKTTSSKKAEDPDETNAYLIITCNDSLGKPLVIEGNGHYIGYADDFKNIFEEGLVKDKRRSGDWTGTEDGKLKISFKEVYLNGEMESGETKDVTGYTTTYAHRMIQPQYKGGLDNFYKFLGRTIRYPKNAREHNIAGKVLVSFVIERDGSPSNFKILASPSDDLSAEVLRVIKLSNNSWEPGLRFGRKVRVQYTAPVNFNLSGG
jgi:TonB family protein